MHDRQHERQSNAQTGLRTMRSTLWRQGLVVAVAAGVIAAGGILYRVNSLAQVKDWTESRAIPTVRLVEPRPGQGSNSLTLPGRLQPYIEAPIYARVNGYLKRWHVDIGTQVKSGQLMAEIDTPELDQQLEQAKADLVSAQSNRQLAEVTAKRWRNLRETDSVSQQEADQKEGDLSARTAAVSAAQANVNRVQALESFKRITAPFDGIVTARKTDIGALINAGAGSSGVELFSVADVRQLRLFVRVPQVYASRIRIGAPAKLSVPEHPGMNFTATLVRTSGAISSSSGTLLAELEIDNKEGLLTPGGYAEVSLDISGSQSSLRVPASALIMRKGGVQLATVSPDNRIVLKKVVVGLDHGSEVEILSGISAGEKIVPSPPDSIEDGDTVRVAVDKPAEAAPATPPTKSKD